MHRHPYLLMGLFFATFFVGLVVGRGSVPQPAPAKPEPEAPAGTHYPVNLEAEITIVPAGESVVTLAPHCGTLNNQQLFAKPVPDRPVTVIRYDGGRVQVGYTEVTPQPVTR